MAPASRSRWSRISASRGSGPSGSDALLPYVDIFVQHMRRMRDNSAADPQTLIDDLTR